VLKGNFVSPEPQLDLEAYLARIEYAEDLSPTRSVLEALHLAHTMHIPFENLDVLLGRPIPLDLPSLQLKIVYGGRGGYCFEHNALFAAVLEQIGFRVTRLAARVRLGTTRVLPRTHMLLQVDVEGSPWIADVGFGGDGLLKPIPLVDNEVVPQWAWRYRAHNEHGLWVLQSLNKGAWLDLYSFTQEPQLPVDFEVANYYASTHPDSRFIQTLTVQLSTPEARYILRDREFLEDRGDDQISSTVENDEELLAVLSEIFGLEFSSGTRFSTMKEEG
jgi:N-hydroxyarylamine O-acetyltransferase